MKKTNKIKEFDDEDEEIETLKQRVIDEAPDKGNTSTSAETFTALPLSRRTLAGLEGAKLFIPTVVQAQALPHALAGRDILGAAKTGSGKTLGKCIHLFAALLFIVLI